MNEPLLLGPCSVILVTSLVTVCMIQYRALDETELFEVELSIRVRGQFLAVLGIIWGFTTLCTQRTTERIIWESIVAGPAGYVSSVL